MWITVETCSVEFIRVAKHQLQDVIQLRRKQLHITVKIQFHEKHAQTFTVCSAVLEYHHLWSLDSA